MSEEKWISAYAAGEGEALVLQQAQVKKWNSPALLGAIFQGKSEREKDLSHRTGAWFQNQFLPGDQALGEEKSLHKANLAPLDHANVAGVLLAGKWLRIFSFGTVPTRVYRLRDAFGKKHLTLMSPDEYGVFEAEEGTVLLLAPENWMEHFGEETLLNCFGREDLTEEAAGKSLQELSEQAGGSAIFLALE
jgi:hypothetical protein